SSVDRLDVDLELAAAGEADLPGLLVGHAVVEQLGRGAGHDLERLLDHGALDAAARDRADHLAGIVDAELAADRSRRRSPGADHGRHRDPVTGVLPRSQLLQDLVVFVHRARSSIRSPATFLFRRPPVKPATGARIAGLPLLSAGRPCSGAAGPYCAARGQRRRARPWPRRAAAKRAPMPLLEIRNLTVEFPTMHGAFKAVDSVDLTVEEGEIVAIVGESGSGKSVSMLAVMGLLPWTARVTADRLAFDGRDLVRLSRAERRQIRGKDMAMIFQEPMTSLNPCFTVGFQVIEAIRAHERTTREEARKRAIALLDQVGIPAPESRLRAFP